MRLVRTPKTKPLTTRSPLEVQFVRNQCLQTDVRSGLVGWGSGAESVTVSGPPRVMPHTTGQEWYEQYLLHRAARKGRPASKRTCIRVYMRQWQMGKCSACEQLK